MSTQQYIIFQCNNTHFLRQIKHLLFVVRKDKIIKRNVYKLNFLFVCVFNLITVNMIVIFILTSVVNRITKKKTVASRILYKYYLNSLWIQFNNSCFYNINIILS